MLLKNLNKKSTTGYKKQTFLSFFYKQSLLAVTLPIYFRSGHAPIRFPNIQQSPAHYHTASFWRQSRNIKPLSGFSKLFLSYAPLLSRFIWELLAQFVTMREIVHIQAGQCGNQIGAKVRTVFQSTKWVIYILNLREKNTVQRSQNATIKPRWRTPVL